MICSANQITGFYITCNTRLKGVKCVKNEFSNSFQISLTIKGRLHHLRSLSFKISKQRKKISYSFKFRINKSYQKIITHGFMGFDFESGNRNIWCRTSAMNLLLWVLLLKNWELYITNTILKNLSFVYNKTRHQLLHFWRKPLWKFQKLQPVLAFEGKRLPVPFPKSQISGTDLELLN